MNRSLLLVPAALAAGFAALPASAVPVAFTATKDTYVESGTNGAVNFGADPVTRLRDGSGEFQITFVSFDISSVTAVPGNVIDGADFEIFKTSGRGDRDFKLYGITDESFDAYGESTLTFNNASIIPAGQTRANSTSAETLLATLLELPRVDGGNLYSVSTSDSAGTTTADLLDFINSDTNGVITLALHHGGVAENGNAFQFASKENTGGFQAPTLRLNVVAVPEPASLGLAAAGGLMLLRRRR